MRGIVVNYYPRRAINDVYVNEQLIFFNCYDDDDDLWNHQHQLYEQQCQCEPNGLSPAGPDHCRTSTNPLLGCSKSLIMSQGVLGAYRNLRLDPSRKEIRVLRIHPGMQSDPLFTVLEVKSLNDTMKQPYDCLSYVWGNVKVTEPMTVNNQVLQVTSNPVRCLRHLRHQKQELVLRHLGEIYSRCSTVYLWLGAPESSDDVYAESRPDPFAVLRQLASNCHLSELPGFEGGQGSGPITFQEDDACLAAWEAFFLIATSPWFQRSWTVQETVLPRTAIAVVGHWRMSYVEDITIARQNRNAHLFNSPSNTCRCHESFKVLPSHLRSTMDRLFSQVEDLEKFRYIQHRDNVVHAHEYRAGSGLFDSSGNCTVPFFDLLRTFASRQCQNPRDKIFSLAAMAKAPAYDSFVPDYRVDTAACYIGIFRQMLEECKYDFRCFVGSFYGSSSPEITGLPSWVCDFSNPVMNPGQELRRLQVYNLYNASGEKTGAPQIRNGIGLLLSGVYVDTIKQVDEGFENRRTCVNPQAVFARWIRMCEHAIGSTDRERVRRAMVSVLCGTVVADWSFRRTRDRDGADDPCLLNDSEWQRLIGGDLHGVPLEMGDRIRGYSGRKMFLRHRRREDGLGC
ncbi:hypothetical protein INS49_014082 [Diaporthe citri]|uniref:uncharacterized protein n=1 Tax=Diaporthe citri TaxID=83186 RepID=UPI001C7ED163|nr:uncharacterized protein INS49_014082 [Diaporthe citri]KAG6358198.1 hypothetical protein INS49_014082 [Diaporthe citri]